MPVALAALFTLGLALAPAVGGAEPTRGTSAGAVLASSDAWQRRAISASSDAVTATLRERLTARAATEPIRVMGIELLDPERITAFYRARNFAPLWQGRADTRGPAVEELLQAIADARIHGLVPAEYHAPQLEWLRHQRGVGADLELLATDALLRHALHRAHGRLIPLDVDPEWHLFVIEADPAALLARLAEGMPPAFLLDDLWPTAPEYWGLIAGKRRLEERASAIYLTVSGGPLLRPGSRGPRVAELRARLGVPPLNHELFDDALERAVREFQQSQGLVVDGIVGANTLDLLNLSDASRIARIDVNLERWRWLMQTLPATRVQVNVADYALQVLDDGREALRMNVIVGTRFRRTPVFAEAMRYLVFNPYWNVPRRIAVNDKLPLLREDAAALAAMGYEARIAEVGATMQPIDAFDWTTVTPRNFNYVLRQRPGEANALGQVKFILPNPYAVYLHDTPARELFARSGRAFSSGCIRLEHAMVLANWVLQDQPQWTQERIDRVLTAGEPVEVPLTRPLPVLVLYFTAVAGESGTVYYRPDLYGRDDAVAAALGVE